MIQTMIKGLVFWRDATEILFFSIIIYYFTLWLRKDAQKNLLGYFYTFLFTLVASHYANLTTMHNFLLITAPVALMLFIITHQEILQRNFIALRNITPARKNTINDDWIEILMRSLLVASSHSKELLCVVENHDALAPFIGNEQRLEIPVTHNTLALLLESASLDATRFIWLNAHGSIVGFNATLQENESDWLHHANMLTTKTDAIFLKVSPTTRSFTIIAGGHTYHNISALHALSTLKKYVYIDTKKGEISYAQHVKKSHQQQSSH